MRGQSANPYLHDHYTKKAQQQGYLARSVYKLEAIDKKHHILRKGQRVLDIGAAPGSWLQYAAQRCGEMGKVVGIDQQPLQGNFPAHVSCIEADIYTLNPQQLLEEYGYFNVVLSDIAPSTTGIKHVDSLRSTALTEQVVAMADTLLNSNGTLVVKLLQGDSTRIIRDQLMLRYKKVTTEKPAASRSHSREFFLVAIEKK